MGRAEREPVVSIDYMFMHDNQAEGEERGMPIMVIKDGRTKVIRARVVPQKGNHAYGKSAERRNRKFGAFKDNPEV